jgi:hypothetical protein
MIKRKCFLVDDLARHHHQLSNYGFYFSFFSRLSVVMQTPLHWGRRLVALAFLPSNFVSSGEQQHHQRLSSLRGESIEMLFPVFEPDQPRDFFSGI